MRLVKLSQGAAVAKMLWPELELEPEGSFWDKYGIDGRLNGDLTTQVKWDGRISVSGNIYHEIYEKSALNSGQPWRKSPGNAELYIFITANKDEFVGYLISVDALAKAETNRRLTLIKPNDGEPTSLGFIIPLVNIPDKQERRISKKVKV